MFNLEYTCFYNDDTKMFSGIDLEILTDEEVMEIRDVIYREDLKNSFGIQDFDEEHIANEIDVLYSQMSDIVELHHILDIVASKLMSTDRSVGFYLLFSYSYFHLTHKIIRKFLMSNEVDTHDINNLTTLVNQK